MSNEYEMPFRPNYELVSAAGWVSGMGMAMVVSQMSHLPPGPFYWMAGIGGAMAVHRGLQGYRHYRTTKGLKGKPLSFIDMDGLLKKMKGHGDDAWLGYGFEWDQRHAQMAHEILKRDKSSILPEQQGIGWRWIHGIEPKERDIYQAVADANGHTLIVGTTGAGKTRTFELLVTQAVLRGEAVFIIDPKGDKELKESARKGCELAGQPDRFVSFHPGFPENSVRLDPLRNFSRPTELATRIAELIPSETGADPFKAFGQMALNNVIQGLLMAGEHPSLVKIRRYLEGGPDGLVIKAVSSYCDKHMPGWESMATPYVAKAKDRTGKAAGMMRFYFEEVQPRAPSSDMEGLLSMFQHDRDHFSRMIASLFPVLNMLTSGQIGELLSPRPENIDDTRAITDSSRIIRNGQVAYIGLDSLTDSMVGSAIGSILLSDLAAVAGDRYNYGVGLKPVNVFIDEAAEVMNDRFIQLLNKGRGALMRLYVATQTFADFAARTGSEHKARQVLGNINNVFALRVLDAETQKYIADGLPKTRVRSIAQSQTTSMDSNHPIVFTGNSGERLTEEEAELFPSAMLGNLPNLEFIAKLSGGRLFKGRLPIMNH